MRVATLVLCAVAAATALLTLPACTTELPDDSIPTASTAKTISYDPTRDPLVNPETLFEPRPPDADRVEFDDACYRNLYGNPASLNPVFYSSRYEGEVNNLLYEGLFTFGYTKEKGFEWLVNDITVEKFEESEDHKTYTVKLRPGLKWHDGAPFSAHDVEFSYTTILDERVPCPAVRSGTDKIESCKAIDDLTVVIVHRTPSPTAKWDALFPIIPKHIYEQDQANNPDLKSGPHNNKYNRAPIGTGPYKFVEWVENDKIVLERWDGYSGARPPFRRVTFKIIPDANMRLLGFAGGEIDEFQMTAEQFATQSGPDQDFARVGFKVRHPRWDLTYLAWNMDGSNPFFTDKRVRYAMTHACDVRRMIRDINYNLYEQARGIFHRENPNYDPSLQLLEFDLDKASQLLEEAGWKIDKGRGGWRHKVIDGKPVKFDFTILYGNGSATAPRVCAIFQEDLKKIGVDMKSLPMEWATFSERTKKHEFQAMNAGWGTGVDPDTLRSIWHSESYTPEGTSGRNYGKFINARVDELFALGRASFDPAVRAQHYREMGRIIYEEQPYTFLWNTSTLWGVSKRFRGLSLTPRGIFGTSPGEFAWWVGAGEGKHPAATK